MLTYFTGIIALTRSGHYCHLNGRPYRGDQPAAMTPWANRSFGLPLNELASLVRPAHSPKSEPEPEGVLYVETVAGWSLVACWDRSAPDNRGGSSATWAVQTSDGDLIHAARTVAPPTGAAAAVGVAVVVVGVGGGRWGARSYLPLELVEVV